jgi:hypothetical protein
MSEPAPSSPGLTERLARWRDAFIRFIGLGAFSGMTLGVWLRVLRENHYAIDWPYWLRAFFITLGTVPNTLAAPVEKKLFGAKIARTEIPPPLIILGTWRSGTTHLHNLFAVDDRFAYPNLYQITYPSTFLLNERMMAPIMSLFVPGKRPMDNMKMGVTEPQEDEFAINSLTGHTPLLTMAFPRNMPFHERYLTLGDLTAAEKEEWKSALLLFARKLTFKYGGRPLVLKSPAHTCRIDVLRELFPQAKFVHIRRNPYHVFPSAKHTAIQAGLWWHFQRPPSEQVTDDMVLRHCRVVYDGFFAQKASIPPGHFHEIAYEDLERDPLGQLSAAYAALGLPEFSHVEPRLRQYVNSLSGYQKNAFKPLPEPLRQRIATEWRRCFEEWGYPI